MGEALRYFVVTLPADWTPTAVRCAFHGMNGTMARVVEIDPSERIQFTTLPSRREVNRFLDEDSRTELARGKGKA